MRQDAEQVAAEEEPGMEEEEDGTWNFPSSKVRMDSRTQETRRKETQQRREGDTTHQLRE